MQCSKYLGFSVVGLILSLSSAMVKADVVAVVSSKSAVSTLSKSQITDIFLGKLVRFPGGSAAEPIDQTEGSIVRDEFYRKIADMSPGELKAFWAKIIFTGKGQPPRAASNATEVKQLIAANPDAIAYMDRSQVDRNIKIVITP